MADLSRALGRHPRWAYKAQERGGMNVWDADATAIAAKLHPSSVWPGWEAAIDREVNA